jgi:SWI/SNF-related matrix-associated actin-dependent regulator 1 of chromatin subfamily A
VKLYPHQERGAEWLAARKRAALFDEQGLGKTCTAIEAAKRRDSKRILVLAPPVVAINWAREFSRWAPEWETQVVTTGRDFWHRKRVTVLPYSLLDGSVGKAIRSMGVRFDLGIFDEAHALKTPNAKRTRMAYGLAHTVKGIAPQCLALWTLTGTPMPNNPSELWTMLRAMAPERICLPGSETPMTFWQFRARFCVLRRSSFTPDGWKVVGAKNIDELRERMRGFSIRRLKDGHLQLPPMRWGTVALGLGVLPKNLRDLEQGRTFESLQQEPMAFSTWRRMCGMAKIAPAAQLLCDELEGTTHSVLVFAHHIDVIAGLVERIQAAGHRCLTITGSRSGAERTETVDAFQAGRARVLVANITAGGVGITLTRASEVVFVENSFVPGEQAQAADRAHRIGQTHPVNVRILSLAGSIDEVAGEIRARKLAMIRAVLA